LSFSWVDPSAVVAQALSTSGKQDALASLGPTIANYVGKIVETFETLQKSEKKYVRTIQAMKEKLKTGKVSIRIVGETSETIDSANSWSIEANGDLFMDVRATHWGKHLSSYTAHRMAKLLNTYSYKAQYGDKIEHVDKSAVAAALPAKKTKFTPGQIEGFTSLNQGFIDAIMIIKEKSGIKLKFDYKTCCDAPVLMVVLGNDQDAKNGKKLAELSLSMIKALAERLSSSKIAQQFLAQNCKSGSSCLRITHTDAYHEDTNHETTSPSRYYATRYDEGDIVLMVNYWCNTNEVASDIDRWTA